MTRSPLDEELDEIRTPSAAELDGMEADVRSRIRYDLRFMLVALAVATVLSLTGLLYYL
ncbi:hypothetical protein WBP07_02675 [Novosphingobium sp. BL-8A]|uniref:hypothetical protein n=1 Tax=Novosphingobium sp. BL-8A TaxID=3127639 RepID=UPI00375706E4